MPRGFPSRATRRSPGPGSGASTRTRASTCSASGWPRAPRCRSPSTCRQPSSIRSGSPGAELRGRPSAGIWGTLADLAAFGRELLAPTLVAPETLAEATAIAFPGLVGVLPGVGRQDPNDWGLGFELKDAKSPHWTGSLNSPATFGHFGGAGTFLWVDPDAPAACACLTDLEFGEWALAAWPPLADAVLSELRAA